ncbi:LOB domain-containing protein 39-like [Magnolia sinica]|uniref:LOB domain-containing protein 39-like n=1 Tax=Magnolia sinica TaxID=86752 RepID=UPI00265B11B6|nr:LOB domain-containing protein 39-like [Magnolia sinica]
MSCNGCRVLRKGCSDSCILRPCLQWIDSSEAQGNATVFVAKFFGRAGLMSFISAVPENQRPALFQSLLFEACGRTINPVNGAVGLLWTGNWHVCQAAVETVLRGDTLRPLTEEPPVPESGEIQRDPYGRSAAMRVEKLQGSDLDLCLRSGSTAGMKRRPVTPNSDGSVTTCAESGGGGGDRKMLNLFV